MATRATADDEFKDTEIGLIPETWSVMCIKELADVRYGRARPEKKGAIPAIGSGGAYAWVDKPLVEFPTIVIGRKGTAGKAWLYKEPCWPSDTTFYLDWTREVDIDFLHGYLRLYPLSGEHAKTTLPSLQKPDLEDYKLPFPPLPEQKRIAHVLSTIQMAIEAQERVINANREFKRSLMHRLFTYGPSVDEHQTEETEAGLVPKSWPITNLGDVLRATQYGLSIRADQDGTYPMLRMNNIMDGYIDMSDLKYIELDDDDLVKYRVNRGDVLFNRTNSYELVGKTGYFDRDDNAVFASYLIRVVPDEKQLLPHFLSYYLNWSQTQQRLKMLATRGVSQSNISATKLKRLLIALPPLHEQEKIILILKKVDEVVLTAERRRAALEAVFKSMLQQLMIGRIRVNDLEFAVSEDLERKTA